MAARGERNWIEITVAVAALVVSGISLWVGVRTEVANQQMVAATTWPVLVYTSSDALPSQEGPVTAMSLTNGGVGPAKVETLELFYRGQPMRSAAAFLRRCCGLKRSGSTDPRYVLSTPAPALLRAGQSVNFIMMTDTPAYTEWAKKLFAASNAVDLRACYCSVLNRCWVSDLHTLSPAPVDHCPVPRVPYRG